jgi:zinc/manganese transport system substrate-binding protein
VRPPLAVLGVAVAAVVGAGCGASSAPGGAAPGAGEAVKVVAAESFWGDIARQLGGDHVSVTSIITDPTADPHQYESDASNAEAVAQARLVIENGVGYDAFVAKLLSATSHSGRVVLSVAQVLRVTGGDANPHLWYDLARIPEVAGAIEAALVSADPADAATLRANLTTFDASLVTLDQLIAEIKRRYPGAPVAYTERVPGYLVAAAGLTNATPAGFAQSIEDGNEPSAGDRAAMDNLMTNHRVRVLLYNSQATSPVTQHVRDVAGRAGIPVVGMTETQPRDEPSYQTWQQHQLQALLSALGG